MSSQHPSRRKFIVTTAQAGIVLSAGSVTGMSLLGSCTAPKKIANPAAYNTSFSQQPLPYSYNALEPYIDAATMEIHFSKHAASYAQNLKEAAAAEGVSTTQSVEDLLMRISKYSTKMRNNAGGHFNHELFWKLMKRSGEGTPAGGLLSAIEKSFGSFDQFKTQFSDAAKNRFGSGWAWLIADSQKQLRIGSTPNQDNPLMDVSDFRGFPLLGLDVWEHAYYLKYQNRRPDYIENWWKVVNWEAVSQRYSQLS